MKTFCLNCVVLEDEDDIRLWLVERLKEYPELKVVGEATNIDDAYHLIATSKPDVAFMDIQLIGGDAFTLLSRLKNNGLPIPYIVIATGYPEFVMTALNDYRQYVVQYLTKPFVENYQVKFRKAIDALMAAKMKDLPLSTEPSKEIEPIEVPEPSFTFLQNKGSLLRIDFDKIAYLEAAGKGESIIVFDHTHQTVDLTLAKFMNLLPDYFYRISRSNIVNTNRVLSINRGDRTAMIIKKPKNKELGISDHYYNDFLQQLPLAKDKLLDKSTEDQTTNKSSSTGIPKNHQISKGTDKTILTKRKNKKRTRPQNTKKNGIININSPQNGHIGSEDQLTFLSISLQIPLTNQTGIPSEIETKTINYFNDLFSNYGIEKNKSITALNNNLYSLSGQLRDDPMTVVSAALEIHQSIMDQKKPSIELKVGIHSALVFPNNNDDSEIKNIAKSIAERCQPGEVNISTCTWKLIRKDFSCRFTGSIETGDGQKMEVYTVKK